MADFGTLVKELEQARSKAAAFYRVDLHVHSYDSWDFPKLGDKLGCAGQLADDDHNAQAKHILDAAKEVEDLRVIAITDHNRSRAAAEISRLSDKDLIVLPGMEVTLQATIFPDSRVHILVIFPEGFSSEDIQQVFPPGCGMPKYDDRSEGSVATIPIDEFIRRVHDLGGICIAGHVNSDKGVRALFRDSNVRLLRNVMRQKELQRRKKQGLLGSPELEQLGQLSLQIKALEDSIQNLYLEFLSDHQFDAVEVQRSLDFQFYTGIHTDELGIRPIPCLLGSDAHNLQDIGLDGCTTYVKMTKPGFRDLRRALLDPGARVRYEDTIQRPRIARILGVRFRGAFFQEHSLGFSDNLTCLIGGRGTGKSAAIEALRYVFEHKLDHLPKEKLDDIEKRRDHTLTGAQIEVLFVDRNGEQIAMRREYGSAQTTCFDVDGSRRDEIDVSVASNLDVKAYGWGEIEELARSRREQLKLIDGFIADSQECVSTVETCIHKLEKNTREIVALAREIEALLPQIAELPAKEEALHRLSTEELDIIFADFDRNETAESATVVLSAAVEGLKTRFLDENAEPYELANSIEQALDTTLPDLVAYQWTEAFKTAVSEQAAVLQNRYQSFLEQFDALKRLVSERIEQLKEEHSSIENELNRQVDEAEEEGFQSLIARRRQLTEEVSDLRAIQKQIQDKQADIDGLMAKRVQEIVPELQLKRRRLTKLRRAKIKEINQRLDQLGATAKVTVDLRHQKEREPFRIALGAPDKGAPDGILKGVYKWYKKYDYAGLYSLRHSPHTFVRATFAPGDFSAFRAQMVDSEGVIREVITQERAEQVANFLSPLIELGEPYYDPQKLEQLLDLEHLDTEDLPIICLDGKPIEELSPGQRCSALIPIILLESNCPLLIDQPEDNLDNKLVFDLVVDILRGLKERRQIIVATHNPNIPVSGDAEQIIVFETSSRECCDVVHQGSIDDETIVQQVKAVMEGSEEAFRIRAEKYGYRLAFVG
jgi:DNA repair ATPase RecN